MSDYAKGAQVGKHNQLLKAPREKMVICSIRNPWDWYVSLWAYGCSGQGRILSDATASTREGVKKVISMARRDRVVRARLLGLLKSEMSRDREYWQDLYSDENNAENFRTWLKGLLGENQSPLSQYAYCQLPVAKTVGFYSFRAARIAIEKPTWEKKIVGIRTPGAFAEFWEAYSLVRKYVRTENLDDDLTEVLRAVGHDVTVDDLRAEKTNTSKHKSFISYYDEETIALVAQRDKHLIAKFGYKEPTIS
ncbi:hypothetical protein [Nereida sp. MMG025]|uniref:hypothetical protein n=1 Tax=Nereida sp. MMG025 TaxID=2909981 RepID=UPI001F260899|nr:hypothetical protein [Nereida sp. MMG025]